MMKMWKTYKYVLLLVLIFFIIGCGQLADVDVNRVSEYSGQGGGSYVISTWSDPVSISVCTSRNIERNPVFHPTDGNLYYSMTTVQTDVPYGTTYEVWKYNLSVQTTSQTGLSSVNAFPKTIDSGASAVILGFNDAGNIMYLQIERTDSTQGWNFEIYQSTNNAGVWTTPATIDANLRLSQSVSDVVIYYSLSFISGDMYANYGYGETTPNTQTVYSTFSSGSWSVPTTNQDIDDFRNDVGGQLLTIVPNPLNSRYFYMSYNKIGDFPDAEQNIYVGEITSDGSLVRSNGVIGGVGTTNNINTIYDDIIFDISPDGQQMAIMSNRDSYDGAFLKFGLTKYHYDILLMDIQ